MIEYLKVVGFCGEAGQPHKEMFEGCQIILVEITSSTLGGGPQGVHPLHINELDRNGLLPVKKGDEFVRKTMLTRLNDNEDYIKNICEVGQD